MVLLSDGRTIGTLGGGCVEAEVRQRALRLLFARKSELLTFKLDHDYGWDDGLICGGVMDIFVQTIVHREGASAYKTALANLEAGHAATIELLYDVEGETKKYSETIEPAPKLLIVGAGHVGQALASIASSLGFIVSVLDDRADLASVERFPNAEKRLVGEIEDELRKYPIDPQTYIVIVTRGHKDDMRVLAWAVRTDARYIGMIGSKRKVLSVYKALEKEGYRAEEFERVHAPVGLAIGALSPEEIAVSITAELIAIRRNAQGLPHKAVKLSHSAVARRD